MTQGSSHDIAEDTLMGCLVGISFCVLASIGWFLGAGDDLDVPLPRLWIAYLVGGATVGAVVGIARPLRRRGIWWRIGAGILAATPAHFALRWGFDLRYGNGWKDWFIFLVFVLVFGAGGAIGWAHPGRK